MTNQKDASKKIKILAVDHHTELGGSEINLINLFKHFEPETFEVHVACPPWGPFSEKLKKEGFTLQPLSIKSSSLATNMIRNASVLRLFTYLLKSSLEIVRFCIHFIFLLRTLKPDLVYLNTLKAGILCSLSCKLLKIPSIQQVQDLIEKKHFNSCMFHASKLLLRIPVRIITISDIIEKSLLSLGINPDKVVRIYNGANIHSLSIPPVTNYFKEKYVGDKTLPSIGIVGRLMKWKGQKLFIEAASKVKHKANFYIIGGLFWEETVYADKLKELVKQLDLGQYIHFTGHIDNIGEAIHSMDIIVSASIEPEPFGLTLIEAMAASRPVIAPRFGAAPEIIVHGKTGLLFNPVDSDSLASCIDYLLANPEEALEMGEKGLERAKLLFDIKKTSDSIKKVITEAVNQR